MPKHSIWIAIVSLILLITVSALAFQRGNEKNEIIEYLEKVNQLFGELEVLQAVSMEATRAGMAGDIDKELEMTHQLISLSEEFLTQFKSIQITNSVIEEIHHKLLYLNQSTHEVLLVRTQILNQIKDRNLSSQEKTTQVDVFWQMQNKNQSLYEELVEELNNLAKKYKIELKEHLSNFI